VPFIGWWREESEREVKGNGDRWRWSLNSSVLHSRRETTGGERMGWRRWLTFTGRWHRRAAGSVWCGGAVSRGRQRRLAHREVGDEGRSGLGGLQRPNGPANAAGPVEEKEKEKNGIGPLEGLGQKEFRVEI
jgi:hypothetical protein